MLVQRQHIVASFVLVLLMKAIDGSERPRILKQDSFYEIAALSGTIHNRFVEPQDRDKQGKMLPPVVLLPVTFH